MARTHNRFYILFVVFVICLSTIACTASINQAINDIVNSFVERIRQAISDFLNELWEGAKEAVLNEVARIVNEEIEPRIRPLIDFIKNGINTINEFISPIGQWINDAVEKAQNTVNSFISSIIGLSGEEVTTPEEPVKPKVELYYTVQNNVQPRECPKFEEKECPRAIDAGGGLITLAEKTPVFVKESVIGEIPPNRQDAMWYQVIINNKEVYIHSSYLTQNPPAPAPIDVSHPRYIFPWRVGESHRVNDVYDRGHHGIDFRFPKQVENDYVVAVHSGTVLQAKDDCERKTYYDTTSPYCNDGMGNFVRIIDESTGYIWIYMHLEHKTIGKLVQNEWQPLKVGEVVNQGDIIGEASCSGHCGGDHLHIELQLLQRDEKGNFLKKKTGKYQRQYYFECGNCEPQLGLSYTR